METRPRTFTAVIVFTQFKLFSFFHFFNTSMKFFSFSYISIKLIMRQAFAWSHLSFPHHFSFLGILAPPTSWFCWLILIVDHSWSVLLAYNGLSFHQCWFFSWLRRSFLGLHKVSSSSHSLPLDHSIIYSLQASAKVCKNCGDLPKGSCEIIGHFAT